MSNDREVRSELGRALAALRRTVTVPCAVCRRPMTGKTHRKTCSEACRSRAYRERKKQRQLGNEEQR